MSAQGAAELSFIVYCGSHAGEFFFVPGLRGPLMAYEGWVPMKLGFPRIKCETNEQSMSSSVAREFVRSFVRSVD